MSAKSGAYSRTELDLLNARRDSPPVSASDITRLYRGNLRGVLLWFDPKPMPDEWPASLRRHFKATEQLVVAFGYPRDEKDFFVVHDLAMRTAVECQLPDDQVAPAGPSSKPSATN